MESQTKKLIISYFMILVGVSISLVKVIRKWQPLKVVVIFRCMGPLKKGG